MTDLVNTEMAGLGIRMTTHSGAGLGVVMHDRLPQPHDSLWSIDCAILNYAFRLTTQNVIFLVPSGQILGDRCISCLG